ncbi:MAG TPA: hypothetical protein VF032_11770 [Thermoleophilaceae bacterium]
MRAGGAALAALAALALSACGGSQQDAHEPSGKFKVEVHGRFPAKQKLAKRSVMVVTVKNVDSRPLPNPSVTVDSFNRNSTQANLADASRPVFIVNSGPVGGDTANQSTSAFGRELRPGQVATFKWNVTAVQPGPFKIKYTVSAGLYGKAVAVDPSGRENPSGHFRGIVVQAAPHTTVNFKNGKTVQGG